MVFVACGINHKTAPLALREKIASSDTESLSHLLQQLSVHPDIDEAAILSTCNRTEAYCATKNTNAVLPLLLSSSDLSAKELKHHTYCYHNSEGIRHAMRVACGLDSMMIGEPQILGQMKKAYQFAEKNGTIGTKLRPIFEHIFSASKRIRSQTALGLSPVSIAYAATNLINRIFPDLTTLTVLLIGSGQTSALVAKYLQKEGVHHFYVASRTLENATSLATSLQGTGLTIGDIPDYLANADIVISATACPLPFIGKSLVERSLIKRNQKKMFFLDLAVPRDIEHQVHELDNAVLYNIDDLQDVVSKGLNQRQDAASQAEQIIEYELDDYIRWHRSLRASDAICDYRQTMQMHAKNEMERVLKLYRKGLSAEQALEELSRRLVNKLTHKPSVGLKRAAADGREDLLNLATYLFKD